MSFDRRNFMIGTGVLAASTVIAPALSVGVANARTPARRSGQIMGSYLTKVGSLQITSLLDGGMKLGNDLLTATPEQIKEAKDKNFIAQGKEFPAYLNGFLINGKKRTLIDTGAANGFGPTTGNLIRNLEEAGWMPSQVEEIILTHAHPDHANGLIDANGGRMFPDAKVRLSEEELNFWFDPAMEAKYGAKKELFQSAQKNLKPYKDSGQIETFKLGADLGGGLSSVALPGHTPGHSGVRVSEGSAQFLIWGDIVHVPAIQFDRPDVSIAFDTDAELAKQTRAKIFDEAATDRIRVGGMHLCFPGIGHVAKRGTSYEFVEQMWETDI